MIVLCLLVAPVISMGASDTTQAWIELLQSEASVFQKARTCQQLGESGTQDAVPALASLLDHPRLSAYARTGLERIPGPEASAALRQAMGQLHGTFQIGVIHSVAVLRDEKAVGALSVLVGDSDLEVGRAALLALGRIANDEALSRVVDALTTGPADSRPDAAAACLLGAGHQLKQGKAESASAIYDTVLQARVPLSYHIGATRGAILSRQAEGKGTSFLVQQWRSKEPAIRNVSLLTIRQNPGEAFAAALNAEIDRAPRDLQIQLIDALTDCHNSQSVYVLWAKVASDDAVVRIATLRVLQVIGGPDSAPVLINVLQENRDEETLSRAVTILERLGGAQVDTQILKALSSSKESQTRIALISLLGKRSVIDAADELLHQAADPESKVSIAAYQALKSLVPVDALPRLIELTKGCRDDSVRDAAVLAVYSVCRDNGDSDQSAGLILRELRTTTVATEQMAWIRVLALLGYSDALPTITAALQDSNPTVVQSTISLLGRWPDPSPIDELFRVVESDVTANVRQRALLAVLQLATAAADRNQVTDEDLVRWFKRAGKAAQSTQEKRLLISGLGRVKHVESVQLLALYLDGTEVKMEAIHAILNAAGPLVKGPDYATIDIILNRMSDLKDPRLLKQIADLQRDIKATAAKLNDVDPMIRKNRMGELVIEAKPGAQVRVEQLKHEFWFGAAISSSAFGGRMNAEAQQKYKDVFLSNFNAAVTENALKWHSMEQRQGQVDYSVVDAMLKWTHDHDIPLRGHNIFWGIPGRVQDWLKALDDEALREALKVRAETIARRYRGQFSEYDLNNEMIHGNYYADRLGPGITKQMIDWIKQIDPDAQLYLNDYDILTGKRLDDYEKHIQGFLNEKADIDGVGVQGHLHGDSFDPAVLHRSLDRLAEAGLPICITEFNFPGQRSRVYERRDIKLTPDEEQAKADAIVEYYRICFAHPAVKGILMWGFWEGANWISQSSLYRRDWTPTPAAAAYQDLVFNQWWTRWEGQADKDGQCRIPAFFGKHRVVVGGQEKTVLLEKSKGVETVSFR